MATAILLPALSPTMNEGKIVRWLKKEGDTIKAGDAIAECETDKSNLEIEAYDDGVLLKIITPAGGKAAVGAPIAYVGAKGEKVDLSSMAPPPAPKPAAAAPAAPVARAAAAPAPVAPVATIAPKPAPPASNGRRFSSPLARKIAAETGVDLNAIAGSGPGGRIVRRDVESARGSSGSASRGPVQRRDPERLELTTMGRVIADRMTAVKPGVPHFYLTVEVDMGAALHAREELKAMGRKVSVNDLIVKATGQALRLHPRVNRTFHGDHLLVHHNCDVGVAVALEDGLITPVITNADSKSVFEISAEMKDLAEKAGRKALRPEQYTGGTITVSNLGMYGIDSFVAVINSPQSAILAIGAVTERAVVVDGAVVPRRMMSITWSGDHRVVDGAIGAEYLKDLKGLLEHPLRLLV